MRYRIDGLTIDGKRVTVCYVRSAYEAKSIRDANRPKFERVLVYDENSELEDGELEVCAGTGSAPDA